MKIIILVFSLLVISCGGGTIFSKNDSITEPGLYDKNAFSNPTPSPTAAASSTSASKISSSAYNSSVTAKSKTTQNSNSDYTDDSDSENDGNTQTSTPKDKSAKSSAVEEDSDLLEGSPGYLYEINIDKIELNKNTSEYDGALNIEIKSEIYKYDEKSSSIIGKPLEIKGSSVGAISLKGRISPEVNFLEIKDQTGKSLDIFGIKLENENLIGDSIYKKTIEICLSWNTFEHYGPFNVLFNTILETPAKCYKTEMLTENLMELGENELKTVTLKGNSGSINVTLKATVESHF